MQQREWRTRVRSSRSRWIRLAAIARAVDRCLEGVSRLDALAVVNRVRDVDVKYLNALMGRLELTIDRELDRLTVERLELDYRRRTRVRGPLARLPDVVPLMEVAQCEDSYSRSS